jgi:hypothetical protein
MKRGVSGESVKIAMTQERVQIVVRWYSSAGAELDDLGAR